MRVNLLQTANLLEVKKAMVTTVTGPVTHTVSNLITPKSKTRNNQGGLEGSAASIRNRHDVQSDAGESSEASGTPQRRAIRNFGTRNETISTAPNTTQRMTQHTDAVPLEETTRKRKKWSQADNLDLMRSYFRATKCDTCKFGYRKRMLTEWNLIRPDNTSNENQLATQLTSISRNNLLSETLIRAIKAEELDKIEQNTENNDNENNPNNHAEETDEEERELEQIENLENSARLDEDNEVTTTRKRKRWSNEDNSNIIRSYLRATKCDTWKQGYRKRMLIEWRLIKPTSTFTENQLATQFTSIKRNTLIPEAIIQRIQSEELNRMRLHTVDGNRNSHTEENQDVIINMNDEDIDSTENPIIDRHVNYTIEIEDENDEERIRLIDQFNTLQTMYGDTEPNLRPAIKKIKPNTKVYTLLKHLNEYIRENIIHTPNLESVQTIVYCAASAITKEIIPNKTENTNVRTECKNKKPKWKERLEKKINKIRSTLNKLNDWQKNKCGRKLLKEVEVILKNLNLNQEDPEFVKLLLVKTDEMKQRIAVYGKRIRRYNISYERKSQNRLFNNNEKTFYSKLNSEEKTNSTINLVSAEELEDYWSNIWKNKGEHEKEATWLSEEKKSLAVVPCMEESNFTINDIRAVVGKLHNWKAPGPDGVQNFWWKNLDAVHPFLTSTINQILNNPANTPDFITQGITYMKAKTEDTSKPQNFRPITCLNTIYKIITSLITNKINIHVEDNELLTEEQKGCRRNTQGCKEQLIIDGIIAKEAKIKQRNIAIAWLDYQKAFDSVPHSYLIEVLKIYKTSSKITNFLQHCMKTWRTKLLVSSGQKTVETNPIPISSGIFQGDSLSPIWFIMCLNPLSKLLTTTKLGYKLKSTNTEKRINHLLYVDDAKLYADSEEDLGKLISITQTFSEDIRMNFGYNKCAKIIYKKGKPKITENTEHILIKQLSDTEKYKYLGLDQHLTRNTKDLKEHTEKKLLSRINKVLKTHLHSRHKIKAINTWAIPIITYTFGVIEWTQTDLERIDRKIRTDMTKNRIHHPNASVVRLYIPRKHGGRGLLNLETLWKNQIINLTKYFKDKQTPLLKTICLIDTYSPLKLRTNNTEEIQVTKTKERKEEWLSKAIHGKYPKALDTGHQVESMSWLTTGNLFGETEGFACAIQDGVISTKNYKKYILKENINDTCRMCRTMPETIQHITSGCTPLAHTEYLKRHNLTAGILHQKIVTKLKLVENKDPYYSYIPHPILENEKWKVYWDITIRTDKTVASNRPDIVLHNKQKKEAFLIDIAHPNDNNLEKTEREKITKYFELCQEYKSIYKLNKVTVIPIIITTSGIISKNILTFLNMIDMGDKYMLKLMQKSVILETCRIVRKVLNIQD